MNVSTRIHRLLWVLLPLLALTLIGCASFIYPTFSHQGRLLDASGDPVADGNYPIEYKLYHVSSGGTAVYTQTGSISVADGYFTSSFGASDADPKIFAEQTWLEISVNGETLSPREFLRGAPYASSMVSGAAIVGSESITYTYSAFDNLGSALIVANNDATATGGNGIVAVNRAEAAGADRGNVAALKAVALGDGDMSTGSYAGIFISNDYRGIYADSPPTYYAAYFDNSIFVNGFCTGCVMALVAQNSGDSVIEPGDFVAAVGVAVDPDYGVPVMLVRKATGGDAVVGVANSGMARGAYHKDALTQPGFDPTGGFVEPGGYVSIVTSGLVQAKIPSEVGLKVGDSFTFGVDGTSEVTSSVEGIAQVLSEADENGLQWILFAH